MLTNLISKRPSKWMRECFYQATRIAGGDWLIDSGVTSTWRDLTAWQHSPATLNTYRRC